MVKYTDDGSEEEQICVFYRFLCFQENLETEKPSENRDKATTHEFKLVARLVIG